MRCLTRIFHCCHTFRWRSTCFNRVRFIRLGSTGVIVILTLLARTAESAIPGNVGELPNWWWEAADGQDPLDSPLSERIGPFGMSEDGSKVVGGALANGTLSNIQSMHVGGGGVHFCGEGDPCSSHVICPFNMFVPGESQNTCVNPGMSPPYPDQSTDCGYYLSGPCNQTRKNKFVGGAFAINPAGHSIGYIGWIRSAQGHTHDQGVMAKWDFLSSSAPAAILGPILRSTDYGDGSRDVRLSSFNSNEFAVGVYKRYHEPIYDTKEFGVVANVLNSGNPIVSEFEGVNGLFANGYGGNPPFQVFEIVPKHISSSNFVAGSLSRAESGDIRRAFVCPFMAGSNSCRITMVGGLDTLHNPPPSRKSAARAIADTGTCLPNVTATVVGYSSNTQVPFEDRPSVGFATDLTRSGFGVTSQLDTLRTLRLKSLNAPLGEDLGESRARSINRFGHVVGIASDAAGIFHAVLWIRNGKTSYANPIKILDIAKLPGGVPASTVWTRFVIANSITDSGRILVVGIKHSDPNLRALIIGPVPSTRTCAVAQLAPFASKLIGCPVGGC